MARHRSQHNPHYPREGKDPHGRVCIVIVDENGNQTGKYCYTPEKAAKIVSRLDKDEAGVPTVRSKIRAAKEGKTSDRRPSAFDSASDEEMLALYASSAYKNPYIGDTWADRLPKRPKHKKRGLAGKKKVASQEDLVAWYEMQERYMEPSERKAYRKKLGMR